MWSNQENRVRKQVKNPCEAYKIKASQILHKIISTRQLDIAKSMKNIVLVCDEFHKMKARGLMKDDFHYYQEAYNEVGTIAGKTAGTFVMDSSLGGENDAK